MVQDVRGDAFAPGSVVAGKYRVDRVLGSGGMAVVLAATHLQLRQPVAIKVLHRQTLSRPGAFDRFVREAQVAMRLRSEHVARVLDIATDPHGTPFIVMELLQGVDLATRLREGGPLAPEDAVDYLIQVCEALAEAHAAGVVHRDLKPANLFLCEGVDGLPLVKVLDFGVSKLLDSSAADAFETTASATADGDGGARSTAGPPLAGSTPVTVTRAFLGSPHYMAPEQIRSARDVDARADVWALGVILYELVRGARPFGGETLEELTRDIVEREPPPLDASLRPLDAALRGALAKDPARRLASARAFAEAVVPFASPAGRASFDRVVRVAESQARAPSAAGGVPSSSSRGGTGSARSLGAARSARGVVALAAVLAVGAAAATWALRRASVVPSPAPIARDAAPAGCTSSRACTEARGGVPSVCRASDRACVPVASHDCEALFEPRDLAADDTIWIGAMFPTRGPFAAAFGTMNREGVDLARREIDAATASLRGSERVPPIALVVCDDGEQPARSARHLVDDVGVPAIVGFRSGQEVVDLAGSLLLPRGVLTVASLTTSPLITRLPEPPGPRLVWRTTFNLDAVADATAAAVRDVFEPRSGGAGRAGPTRVALARVDMSTGLAFAERFFGKLSFNGKSAMDNGRDYLELTFPQSAKPDDLGRVADALVRQRATIVVLCGDSADSLGVVEATEARWPAGAPRPTYVLASDSTAALAPWIAGRADRRHRVFAVGSASQSEGNARFVIRYNQTHATPVTRTFNPSSSYDAFYLVAYAAFARAGKPVTGASLAEGIARLVGPGPRVTTGPMDVFAAVAALDRGDSVDLQGTASALDFDLASGEAPADFVVLCPSDRAPEDVESGVVYPSKERRITGALDCP